MGVEKEEGKWKETKKKKWKWKKKRKKEILNKNLF